MIHQVLLLLDSIRSLFMVAVAAAFILLQVAISSTNPFQLLPKRILVYVVAVIRIIQAR